MTALTPQEIRALKPDHFAGKVRRVPSRLISIDGKYLSPVDMICNKETSHHIVDSLNRMQNCVEGVKNPPSSYQIFVMGERSNP